MPPGNTLPVDEPLTVSSEGNTRPSIGRPSVPVSSKPFLLLSGG